MNLALFDTAGATFSKCRSYRYNLYRRWSSAPAALFVMLNPSTADEIENDPTIERCQRRALDMGYGGIAVVNLFALRATDPRVLYRATDPVGPDNDVAIVTTAKVAGIVICGWEMHGHLHGRGEHVLALLVNEACVTPHALRLNADRTPCHPLYLPYNAKPFPLRRANDYGHPPFPRRQLREIPPLRRASDFESS